MNNRILITIAMCAVCAGSASARLGEDMEASEKRYGKPVADSAAYPLIRGAEHRVYHHEGWKISVAFIDDKAACIEYAKLRQADRDSTVVIQQAEIDALLKAEAGGGEWTQKKEEASSNPFKALGKLMDGRNVWENSNGSTATLKQNKLILRFETAEAKASDGKDMKGF